MLQLLRFLLQRELALEKEIQSAEILHRIGPTEQAIRLIICRRVIIVLYDLPIVAHSVIQLTTNYGLAVLSTVQSLDELRALVDRLVIVENRCRLLQH